MCPAHIAFSTPKKFNLTWTDTFEDIKDVELEQLIIECRGALHSLEAELAARQNPRVDTKLEDCYARLQEKARTIKNMGALSNKDRASLEEAGTFLKALRGGHIDSSQTRETRKGGAMYEQLLWLISRVAGPAYALLLICGVARRTVERLNSFQSAVLVKRMARYYDSLSSHALEEKANEFGLFADATSVIQRVSRKRKHGQCDNTTSSIAWTDPVSVSFNESSPSKICDSSRQVRQKVNSGVNLLNSYYPGEVNGVTQPETDFNSGILTPNSNTSNDDDKNTNSTVPGNDIGCGVVVRPQNQVAAFSQPANEAIFKDAGSRLLVCENGAHDFDGTDFMTDSTINLVISSTQPRNLLDTKALPIKHNDLAPMGNKVNDSTEAASISSDRDRASLLPVEPESRDAQTLLRLLCFLDGTRIPEFMLIRAKEPQKIWSPSGEIQKVPVTEVGLNSDVISLVSDNVKIDEAIKQLEAAMLITSELGAYGHRTLHIDSATQLRLTQCLANPLTWRLQALILVCHTFPMHPYVEPLYGPLGRLQILQVQCVMNHHFLFGTLLSSRVKCKVAEVLLAASYFLDISWKSKALEAVKAITTDKPTDYLRIWSNLRECTLAGLEIGNEITESAIHSVGHGQIDARSNALYGQLILSYTSNKIRWNKLDHARSMLDRFSPLNSDSPSTMERLVLKKKEVTIGRIDRYQGKFWLAREHLTPLPDVDAKLDGVTGRGRISQLACVLCELGEPRKAQILLCEEIKIMEKLGSQDISSGRCLRLSLAEALLQQGSLKEAENIYLRLKEVVEDCPNPNFAIGIEKLRFWMGLARILHLQHSWSDALTKWEKALRAAEDCNWRAGFIEMVVRYSISDVKSTLGEREDSESHSKKADELYRREGRQFWLTGLGTYWLDFIWRSLSHKPGTL